MKKGELIAHMAKEAGITKSAAAKALNSIIEAIHGTLKKSEIMRIAELGSFDGGPHALWSRSEGP